MLPEARHRGPWLVVGLLVATLAAPMVQAHTGHGAKTITLEAGEGDACPDGDSYCLKVVEGDPADVAAGNTVELTFQNPSSNGLQHNVHVTDTNAANRGQDTSAGAAFANTNSISPGESTTINFTVPDDADGTYLWCTIGGHESGGMWLLGGAAANETTSGGGEQSDFTNEHGSPGFTTAGALAAASLAMALAGRRRD